MLHGRGPADLVECTLVLGREMLLAGGVERKASAAERRLRAALQSGAAAAKMEALIAAQHGDPRVVREPDRLPRARYVARAAAQRDGFVQALDAHAIGQLAVQLGAGRTRVDQAIDPAVGLVLHKKPGDRVRRGEVLAELHVRGPAHGVAARPALLAAYAIGARRPHVPPLVIGTAR